MTFLRFLCQKIKIKSHYVSNLQNHLPNHMAKIPPPPCPQSLQSSALHFPAWILNQPCLVLASFLFCLQVKPGLRNVRRSPWLEISLGGAWEECGKPAVPALLPRRIRALCRAPRCPRAAICSSAASHGSLGAGSRCTERYSQRHEQQPRVSLCQPAEVLQRGWAPHSPALHRGESACPANSLSAVESCGYRRGQAPASWLLTGPSRSTRHNRWLLCVNTTEELFRSWRFSALLLFNIPPYLHILQDPS